MYNTNSATVTTVWFTTFSQRYYHRSILICVLVVGLLVLSSVEYEVVLVFMYGFSSSLSTTTLYSDGGNSYFVCMLILKNHIWKKTQDGKLRENIRFKS